MPARVELAGLGLAAVVVGLSIGVAAADDWTPNRGDRRSESKRRDDERRREIRDGHLIPVQYVDTSRPRELDEYYDEEPRSRRSARDDDRGYNDDYDDAAPRRRRSSSYDEDYDAMERRDYRSYDRDYDDARRSRSARSDWDYEYGGRSSDGYSYRPRVDLAAGLATLQPPVMGPPAVGPPMTGQPFTQLPPVGGAPYAAPTPGQPMFSLYDAAAMGENAFWKHRTGVFGEFLYLRPRNAEVAYAVPIDGPVLPILIGAVPIGPAAVVDYGYDWGFRAGFDVAINGAASVGASYTRFHTTASDSQTIAPPDVLRSLVSHPLGLDVATDTLDASATSELRLDMIDIDYRAILSGYDCYAWNYLGGARWAQLEQDFSARFVTVGTQTVTANVDFEGVGARLGLDGERVFCGTGCLVYGKTILSLLAGNFTASYTETDPSGVTIVSTSWESGRVVPIWDLELGVGWISPMRHVRLTAGYMFSAWFNTVKMDEFIQQIRSTSFVFEEPQDVLTFDGLVARAEVQF